jgi:site-specific DNA-methyltransferase (adenine-specific)
MKDPCLADVFEGRARWCVALSDCRFALGGMPDASVDACVCDPPYGLSREPDALEVLSHWLAGDDYEHGGSGFMGKTWDSFVPGPSTWREVFRVLKPGGHLVAFGGTSFGRHGALEARASSMCAARSPAL